MPVPCEGDSEECLGEENPGHGHRDEQERRPPPEQLEVAPGRVGIQHAARDRERDQRSVLIARREWAVERRQ
jgi:hypothetical protein